MIAEAGNGSAEEESGILSDNMSRLFSYENTTKNENKGIQCSFDEWRLNLYELYN